MAKYRFGRGAGDVQRIFRSQCAKMSSDSTLQQQLTKIEVSALRS